MELIDAIDYISNYSRLNSNVSNFFGIGALKVVHVAAYGLKSADLTPDSLKILGVHFSYNKKLQNEKNFSQVILDTQNTLIMMDEKSNYKRESKEIQTISPIEYCLSCIIETYNNKHKTLILEYTHRGLKCADLTFKIISLQNSWVKRLYNESFHEWKMITLFK